MAKRATKSSLLSGAMSELKDAQEGLASGAGDRFRHTFEVGLDQVHPNPDQPRRIFDEDEIQQLAASLGEQGLLQPILVRRDPDKAANWIIIAGERRWRAARLSGWTTILAIEASADPEVAALVENLQRVDLTAVEEARGLKRLIESHGMTQTAAAKALGKHKVEVSCMLRVANMRHELLELALDAALPKSLLIEIARIDNADIQSRLIDQAVDGRLTVQAVRKAKQREEGAEPAPEAAPKSKDQVRRPISTKALAMFTNRLKSATAPRAKRDEHKARLLELRGEIDRIIGDIENG